MHRVAALLSTLALLVPPLQAAPQGAPRDEGPGEVRVVAAVVGDELIKGDELIARIQLEMAQGRIRDVREVERRERELLEELVTSRLKVQAGKDMGLDPALLRNYVDRLVDRQVERYGGTVQTSEFLERNRIGPGEWRSLAERDVYANQWELSVLGLGPSPSGRITVDRYIRPGELHAYYRSLLVSRDPASRGQAGAQPERVVLQELILPLADQDPEVVLDRARFLLEAHAAGADFTELVQLHGVAQGEDDGIRKAQPVAALRAFSEQRHGSPALFDFARGAAEGQVSEPLPGAAQSGDRAVWIYRLVERQEARDPLPFDDPELQDDLRDRLQERIDEARETAALQRVARSVYFWPRDTWTAAPPPEDLSQVDF